jgi:DNA/RNA non-specific endonuclease/Bacterial TSP3 repeat
MRRSQRGQTSIEYVGVLALAAVVFAAIFAAGLPGTVSRAVHHAICGIEGAACGVAPGQAGSGPRSPATAGPDADHDGVSDADERRAGTDPRNADTDGDGVIDSQDPFPTQADTDGDGLTDGAEIALGSNPGVADTDGDGVPDGEEYRQGTDPTVAIKPLTKENAQKPWERLGMTEDQWNKFAAKILDKVNPHGWKAFIFGQPYYGVDLDANGHIRLLRVQEAGMGADELLEALLGAETEAGTGEIAAAASEAAADLPEDVAAQLARYGVVEGVPRAEPPEPPATPGTAYGELDALGRPTGAAATIDRSLLRTGTSADRSIRPPGYEPGATPPLARGHLVAKLLGGSGGDARNLVTLIQNPTNTPVMSAFERQIATAVEDGQVVKLTAQPIYRGAEAMPRAVTLSARGSGGFQLDVTVLNQP